MRRRQLCPATSVTLAAALQAKVPADWGYRCQFVSRRYADVRHCK